jgi:hypothetical protein
VVLSALGPAPLSRVVAEGFHIPSIGTYLVAAVPTAQFPRPAGPSRSTSAPLATWRPVASYSVADLYAEIVPRLRARLGLPTTDSAWLDPPEGRPIWHRFSRTVVPRRMTGPRRCA